MDSEEIRQVLYKERSQSLRAIPAEFFLEAGKYVRELEEEIRKIDNLRSPELKMLNGEYERTTSFLETIFMNRIKKVLDRASTQAQAHSNRPIAKDLEKLLPVEKRLYDLVLAGIEAAKFETLGPILNPEKSAKPVFWPELVKANESDRAQPENYSPNSELFKSQKPTPNPLPFQGSALASTAKEKVKAASGKTDINKDFVLVRILKDLPTFTGADGRNYTVKSEDLVVLPRINATGLLKRKAAKLICKKAKQAKSPV
ncbi:MAG: hypothetical protein PHD41_03390 [Methanosarcinaceae archaeon]|nr:hypothetical protein [Methanosarcinaceae archaeon]MDD4331538.1 hypothetical protein [Methanosarcinaceae archaeon]